LDRRSWADCADEDDGDMNDPRAAGRQNQASNCQSLPRADSSRVPQDIEDSHGSLNGWAYGVIAFRHTSTTRDAEVLLIEQVSGRFGFSKGTHDPVDGGEGLNTAFRHWEAETGLSRAKLRLLYHGEEQSPRVVQDCWGVVYYVAEWTAEPTACFQWDIDDRRNKLDPIRSAGWIACGVVLRDHMLSGTRTDCLRNALAMAVPARNDPCRRWRRGNCMYGDGCRFSHSEDQQSAPEHVPRSAMRITSNGNHRAKRSLDAKARRG
jgi:hypothetical protein